MDKIFLVEWSAFFDMNDVMHFKDLVWATSAEEAKEKIWKAKAEKVHSENGLVGSYKITECIPQNGIFHLDTR